MPNIPILVIVFILGYAVIHSSAKKDAQKTPDLTGPAMVQGEASGGAWLLAIVILIVGLLIAFAPR